MRCVSTPRVELRDDRQHAEERNQGSRELPAGQPVANIIALAAPMVDRPSEFITETFSAVVSVQPDELQRAEQRAAGSE